MLLPELSLPIFGPVVVRLIDAILASRILLSSLPPISSHSTTNNCPHLHWPPTTTFHLWLPWCVTALLLSISPKAGLLSLQVPARHLFRLCPTGITPARVWLFRLFRSGNPLILCLGIQFSILHLVDPDSTSPPGRLPIKHIIE